jgi:alpha-galactosidase
MSRIKKTSGIILCYGVLTLFMAVSVSANTKKQSAEPALAQCKATLVNNILTLENAQLSRVYDWNGGDLKSKSVTDKKTNYSWALNSRLPDAIMPGTGKAQDGKLVVRELASTSILPACLEAEITLMMGTLEVKRVFHIFPDCPAISCTFYLRGSVSARWSAASVNSGDLRNIETAAAAAEGKPITTFMEQLTVPGKHWHLRSVQFYDITDRNNTLVQTYDRFLYRNDVQFVGNLLFADEVFSDHGLFILKEAPTSTVQLASPGFDFIGHFGSIQTVGLGVVPQDLDPEKWTRCYGFVTGVTSGGELGRLSALRTYQQKVRTHESGRDDMILMNTWGDRNQDKHIGETFTLREIEAAHRLGITHFQIDDGWQTGRSANSAIAKGSSTDIWKNPDYWKPDPVKFPNGLSPVVAMGKKLGMQVCLWFNPAKDSSYAHWADDARTLLYLYEKEGIHTFKIDGVQVDDKASDVNLRKMFDTVMKATNNQVVFNLDATAGKRYGYHYFNEYGNIFLENRYTDWGSYYPHSTLRNLWMLSRYVPAQNLQIEFLNNFRNADKYPEDDLLAPSKVSFEYEFALTMMAQPLAWMEATGLPEKAFATAPVIKKYQTIQSLIHAGQIFPIGNEPSGMSWTGFQSINGKQGYILVIRERNDQSSAVVKTWLGSKQKVQLKAVFGTGKDLVTTTGMDGSISFHLSTPNSYALYQYLLL